MIVAHTDNTEIYINGNNDPVETINAGQYYIIEGENFTNENMYVNTSEDVFVYQGIGGLNSQGIPSEANQGMFFVPPLSCGSRGDVNNIPSINQIGNRTLTGGVTIVTRNGAQVFINNKSITNQPVGISVGGPTTVDGNNEYVTYKVNGLNGDVSINSDNELYVSYYNFDGAASSGSFYSGFASNPSLDLDLTATKLGSCLDENNSSNVILSVNNSGNFDSLQWEKKNTDGSWDAIDGETNLEFLPNELGDYRV